MRCKRGGAGARRADVTVVIVCLIVVIIAPAAYCGDAGGCGCCFGGAGAAATAGCKYLCRVDARTCALAGNLHPLRRVLRAR